MIRLRAWWVLVLVWSVSGCAGTNRRPAWQPSPPMLGVGGPAGTRGDREPVLAREGPAADEVGPETRREPSILSRYFPGLSRRGTGASSPVQARSAEGGGRPLSTASARAAARGGPAEVEAAAAGGTAPLLSVAIDVPAPSAEAEELSVRRAEAGERLTSLETAPKAEADEPSGQPEAAEPDPPPPLAEAKPSATAPTASDPDADSVLAGRPRLRRMPQVPPSGLATDLPAAMFPRTYYKSDSPPLATRVPIPEPTARPRRPWWPRLFRPERTEDAPAASVRGESDHVPQRG